MRKIGILGGTFNPIHNGHLALAEAALQQYDLQELWLMPSKLPPHKSHFAILSEEHRLAMTQFAARTNEKFVVSDFELRREGLTYTADTLELLKAQYPDTEFYFIIGGDSLINFTKWRRPERILELCTLLAAGRSGYKDETIKQTLNNISKAFPYAKLGTIQFSDYPISSNEIRQAFYGGTPEAVKQYLPEAVWNYLKENKLFVPLSFAELDEEMQRVLPRKRYIHSVAVAHLAAAYAASVGITPERALIAGILHDCAKAYSDEQLVADCDKYSIPVTPTERRNGFLLHGKLGAFYAKEKYFIFDSEILSAISCHTTGKPGMTVLEKIIFLADYLEPFRTQPTTPELNAIRETAFQDLDKAVYYALKNTLNYLKQSGRETDKTTEETYLEYKKRYEPKEG